MAPLSQKTLSSGPSTTKSSTWLLAPLGSLLTVAASIKDFSTTTKLLSKSAQMRVAVIFFGGNDDREALVYAKRMARYSSISLTVVRLIAMVDEDSNAEEKMLDSFVLNDVNNVVSEYVFYAEEVVKDGPETAFIVLDMVGKFDLIIVGRHKNVEFPQTSGLSKGSEFPEFGAIGCWDMNPKTQ